jgi:hypothetical protein
VPFATCVVTPAFASAASHHTFVLVKLLVRINGFDRTMPLNAASAKVLSAELLPIAIKF